MVLSVSLDLRVLNSVVSLHGSRVELFFTLTFIGGLVTPIRIESTILSVTRVSYGYQAVVFDSP